MKVFILRWGDSVLGVFSSKELADEAEEFYSVLPAFDNQNADFGQEEYELNKFSDENYKIDDELKDNSLRKSLSNFMLKMMFYALGIILILGISTFFELVFNLFKH
jgi:hypothetical protein